ncbi:MAG: hypothetical protein U1F77_17040 [Kiritimatiellia bacterium]
MEHVDRHHRLRIEREDGQLQGAAQREAIVRAVNTSRAGPR